MAYYNGSYYSGSYYSAGSYAGPFNGHFAGIYDYIGGARFIPDYISNYGGTYYGLPRPGPNYFFIPEFGWNAEYTGLSNGSYGYGGAYGYGASYGYGSYGGAYGS